MKVLVIGGSGLVGSHVLKAALAAGHQAIGTYRRSPLSGLVPLDAGDAAAAGKLLDQEKPDAVVHAAGWTWVDGCEDDPKRAFAENAEQPANLARLCQKRGIHFTYFSTSYIFDGLDGPYDEDAKPNPINVYSQSKWEGEQRVQQETDGTALLPRIICVYGAEVQKKNFAYQVWNALREGKALTLPSDQCGNPTYAGDIARWLITLLEKRERGPWHLGGPWPTCTRPEWAEKLIAAFKAEGIISHPNFAVKTLPTADLRQKALRPLRAGMISMKAFGGEFESTEFNQTIRELVANSI
ncbi:SDR family oxidoreductase [Pedosphaera parvula]|uniref:dTDP-4-dehydrorhamnose reductase n=1 Tax=Pedosphaera parvula (strain Ellin514) TaxID=320771 RepID=B9XIP2_PEDPL|nr:SDR family oxidoreductase [Pedosphaera parvula]EEF60305.1 dTDP-4-dehydrorhamnose reductase [Pedosphaera parvula Ellin514]